jgi:transcriptional regulator GlxA family with amidase domain
MRYGILLYDGVEPIDVGATFGVLSMARRVEPGLSFFGIARHAGPVVCANRLRVEADHGFADCPAMDVLVVTGGPGWMDAAADAETLAFVRRAAGAAAVASICTGAMILAAAGLLDGRTATTKREVVGAEIPPVRLLRERHPGVKVVEASVVQSGRVVTSGGVSLGIDGMLHLLAQFHGAHVADETARILEYQRAWHANRSALPPVLGDGTPLAAAG